MSRPDNISIFFAFFNSQRDNSHIPTAATSVGRTFKLSGLATYPPPKRTDVILGAPERRAGGGLAAMGYITRAHAGLKGCTCVEAISLFVFEMNIEYSGYLIPQGKAVDARSGI